MKQFSILSTGLDPSPIILTQFSKTTSPTFV